MGYYRGDYYRGDLRGFRGDPGLFSFLGKAVGGIAKFAGGAVKSALGLGPAPGVPQILQLRPPPTMQPFGPTLPGGGDVYDGGGGGSYGGNVMAIPTLTKGSLGPGGKRLHPNRSTYVTRGGGTSRWPHALQVHQKGEVLVGPRRMNVGNARAVKRAVRRLRGFAHLAKRVLSFVSPRAPKGRAYFPKRKTKRLHA